MGLCRKIVSVSVVFLAIWLWNDTSGFGHVYFDASSLGGKRVVVCGASDGIGAEMAKHYASGGAHVVIAARTRSKLEKVAAECAALGAASINIVAVDVGSEAGCEELIRASVEHLGGDIDIFALMHVKHWFKALQDVGSFAEIKESLTINLFSYLYLARLVLPLLKQSRGNLIVSTSFAGKSGIPYVAPYSAAKHAMHGYFESLRHELFLEDSEGYGVKITMAIIGNIDTQGAKDITKGYLSHLARHPADECARAIVACADRSAHECYYPYWETRPVLLLQKVVPSVIDFAIRATVKS